ncbi:MAG: S-adenosylmethionine:tRNA ribosyltransferase-isomerase [Pseudoflavonifractor sp.]|nr:S-adenosylmethionine:tRNA ribosyltransferase-isomerase [Pseudoflavonifractor sp.]
MTLTDPRDIRIEQFTYDLPDGRIARHPLERRDECKLLVRQHDGRIEEHLFAELPGLLPDDSMLVYNNTRVINARLRFHKGDDNTGALIEIFCLEPQSPRDYARNFASTDGCSWICFVGNSKRWKDSPLHTRLTVDGMEVTLTATREEKLGNASVVRFDWNNPTLTFARIIEAAGEIPIPPYLNRATEKSDTTDYQTVYSHIDGSVAAPTAGLHFTPGVLEAISRNGIPRRELTLHVGAGTFQPVKSDSIGEHEMHSEFISIPLGLIDELATTERRVIAVGTTSVRTLESLYHIGCLIHQGAWDGEVPQWYPYSESHPRLSVAESLKTTADYLRATGAESLIGSTRIIIAPGYDYRIVKGMITNFHQPQSTLLLLVSAFVGGNWRAMYDFALTHGFRFLSYGDASLLL